MLAVIWTAGLLRRRRARLAGTTIGIAVAVALVGSIGAFLSASKATMTARASRSVAVAWQIETRPGADPAAVERAVASFSAIHHAAPVLFATTTRFGAVTGPTTQTTGPGVVLGVTDAYRHSFPDAIRDLVGSTNGVLVAQQTAANLHVMPGDTVTVGRAGLPDATVTVDGVVDLPAADSLFQNIGAPAGSQPQAPPDNVLVVPDTTWHDLFDPLTRSRPDLVAIQIHTSYDRALPADPAAAYTTVLADARHLELALHGGGVIGDNLAAALGGARSDSLYAQILFLFLGAPGVALAGLLTATVAATGSERRRRDQALLRARGASTRHLVAVAFGEAVVATLVGTALGLGTALAIGRGQFGAANFGATTATTAGWIAGACAAGLAIALGVIVLPAWRDGRTATVATARRDLGRARDPRWLRSGADVLALATSLLAFWATSRNGYKLVLAVEGVATISVNYWAFAGPALLWVAAALLAWRIANTVLRRGRRAVAVVARPISGALSGTVAAAMSRQRRVLARGLMLVALTVAFAASTAVFNATYQQQAEVDALLSNGADVTVVEPPGVTVHPDQARLLGQVPGVTRVTSIQHRFAYVGNDLQDIYGVDPTTIVEATKLQDAYFQGGTAKQLMARLTTRPDAVLVSAETAHDFQLVTGDTVRLRLQDGHTGQYTDVPFTFAGIVNEFPTAPKDSFLVANANYLASNTATDTVGAFLLDTAHGDTSAVAKRVRAQVGTSAQVNDIANKRRMIGSSLTSVELAGLTRVELAFALVLAAAATGLVLWLGLNERQRTFALASALGANPRQLRGFVWSEALFVSVGGLVVGATGALALTQMIVKVLTGVFDPPPSTLAIPWRYLGLVLAAAVAAVLVATNRAVHRAQRPAIEVLRDL